MAYNYFPQYQYQYQTPQQFQQQQYQQPMQIQNGGFISVRSMEEAYSWPVAPGNSITFKDENAPYVYTKTKGFSQLDQPVFEKYRLVKEEEIAAKQASSQPQSDDQIKALWDEIQLLRSEVDNLKSKIKPAKAAVKPEKEVKNEPVQ